MENLKRIICSKQEGLIMHLIKVKAGEIADLKPWGLVFTPTCRPLGMFSWWEVFVSGKAKVSAGIAQQGAVRFGASPCRSVYQKNHRKPGLQKYRLSPLTRTYNTCLQISHLLSFWCERNSLWINLFNRRFSKLTPIRYCWAPDSIISWGWYLSVSLGLLGLLPRSPATVPHYQRGRCGKKEQLMGALG